MSYPSGSGEEKKTVAIRVSPELRGRLESVLQITGITVNDAGIEAIEAWIANKLSDSKVREKARKNLAERQRALAAEAEALEGLIGTDGETATEKPSTTSRRGKTS